jgi:predicted 3-demethylubiquinone-9 3-methyltransferase (glyoxalase superfamily)
VTFELDGTACVARNGGAAHRVVAAVSFVIACKDHAVVEHCCTTCDPAARR